MPVSDFTKEELYKYGKVHLGNFLAANNIARPKRIMTYEEAYAPDMSETREGRMLRKLAGGPHQGTGTGWYYNGYIFVNLKRAARLVKNPAAQNWSHPHYKIDREPCGVVCHEGGHHVQAELRRNGGFDGFRWRAIVSQTRKRVSGYEPVLDEAFAESMRVFILNPGLLKAGLPARYDFIHHDCGLVPHIDLDWRMILQPFSPVYTLQAEKWIAQ